MPKPEGYRKALRIMGLAEKFRLPILTFIDTPGAYPGMDAEERGQAEAIAWNLEVMARLRTPIIVTVTGEGGSGGALALGIGDRINMLQYAIYSVISPEGCAAILWKDAAQAERPRRPSSSPPRTCWGWASSTGSSRSPWEAPTRTRPPVFSALDAVLAEELEELSSLGPEELFDAATRSSGPWARTWNPSPRLPAKAKAGAAKP